MHILQLTPYYVPAYSFGGVVTSVEGMSKALVARGHQVTVLTTDALDPQHRIAGRNDEVIDGVRVVRVPNRVSSLRKYANISTPVNIKTSAQELLSGVDLLHCHEFRTMENLWVTKIAQEQGVPVVLSPHGTMTLQTGRSFLKSLWDRIISPSVAKRIDAVIALTQQEMQDCSDIWEKIAPANEQTQFHIVPNGIDLASFQNLPDGESIRSVYGLQSKRVVLFVGRLQKRKGVDILVQAFQQANIPDAHLLIVGPDEGMAAKIAPFLDERITLTGYLEGDARLLAYAIADLFALPAIGEGFSMAVLEAMGAGVPVLLSPGCNFPEAVRAGAGKIADANIQEFAEALRLLFSDMESLQNMGQAAQRLVTDHYTWNQIAGQLEEIYSDLLKP